MSSKEVLGLLFLICLFGMIVGSRYVRWRVMRYRRDLWFEYKGDGKGVHWNFVRLILIADLSPITDVKLWFAIVYARLSYWLFLPVLILGKSEGL